MDLGRFFCDWWHFSATNASRLMTKERLMWNYLWKKFIYVVFLRQYKDGTTKIIITFCRKVLHLPIHPNLFMGIISSWNTWYVDETESTSLTSASSKTTLISTLFMLDDCNEFDFVTFLRTATVWECLPILTNLQGQHSSRQQDTRSRIPMRANKELDRVAWWISVTVDFIFVRLMSSEAWFNWLLVMPHF